MRTAALVFVGLIFLSSCSAASRQGGTRVQDRTMVRVENQNLLDMTVYIVRGSQRVRLGMVTGLSTRVFVIPESLLRGANSVRFLADPIGSRQTPVSQEMLVLPGDEVEIVIPN